MHEYTFSMEATGERVGAPPAVPAQYMTNLFADFVKEAVNQRGYMLGGNTFVSLRVASQTLAFPANFILSARFSRALDPALNQEQPGAIFQNFKTAAENAGWLFKTFSAQGSRNSVQ